MVNSEADGPVSQCEGPRHDDHLSEDTRGASEYLWKDFGIRQSPATLKKKRSIGGGPAFRKTSGRLVIYERRSLRQWANTQRSPLLASTSELPRAAPDKNGT
jgi:hypothetical protein